MTIQVTCIEIKDRHSPHERIRKIGGANADGTGWWLTLDEALVGILESRYSFYVQVGALAIDVIGAEHNGRKYLKTKADGVSPDNLLSLPACFA